MTPTFVAALALFALAVPLSAQSDGSNRPKVPAITVSGSGEIRVAPDLATVRLGVVAQHENAATAQQDASRIAQAILAGVAALDVPREAVQTSQLILSPVYEQPRPQHGAARAPHHRLPGLERGQRAPRGPHQDRPVIDAAIDAGANQVDGVDFQLQNDREAREEALRRAVREARGKAAAMAEALDVSLGPVLDAREGGVSVELPQFRRPAMFAMEARAPEPPRSPPARSRSRRT